VLDHLQPDHPADQNQGQQQHQKDSHDQAHAEDTLFVVVIFQC